MHAYGTEPLTPHALLHDGNRHLTMYHNIQQLPHRFACRYALCYVQHMGLHRRPTVPPMPTKCWTAESCSRPYLRPSSFAPWYGATNNDHRSTPFPSPSSTNNQIKRRPRHAVQQATPAQTPASHRGGVACTPAHAQCIARASVLEKVELEAQSQADVARHDGQQHQRRSAQ